MKCTDLKNPPVLIQVLLSTLLSITCALTIMLLWGWFIVPLGLPAINIAHAYGIDLLVTFLVTTEPPKEFSFWDRWIHAVMFAIMTLLCGWVLHFAV